MAKAQRGSDNFIVRIPEPLKTEMLQLCATLGMNKSELIREALRKYLDKFEEKNVDPFGIIKEESI